MFAIPAMLAVLLLSGPDVDTPVAPMRSAAHTSGQSGDALAERKVEPARISSVRANFDRDEGVAVFEGKVAVDYGDSYHMRADRVFVFFIGTNEFDRVVADGNVAITNDVRSGSCASAVFRRRRGEVEMFGGNDGSLATLSGAGDEEVKGRRIRFWIDAEQVEVTGSEVKVGREKSREVKL